MTPIDEIVDVIIIVVGLFMAFNYLRPRRPGGPNPTHDPPPNPPIG